MDCRGESETFFPALASRGMHHCAVPVLPNNAKRSIWAFLERCFFLLLLQTCAKLGVKFAGAFARFVTCGKSPHFTSCGMFPPVIMINIVVCYYEAVSFVRGGYSI